MVVALLAADVEQKVGAVQRSFSKLSQSARLITDYILVVVSSTSLSYQEY